MNQNPQSLYWIGTDEAGYGPNLGPLSIGGSLWELEADALPVGDFSSPEYLDRLEELDWFAGFGDRSSKTGILIADSKRAYKSGDGLGPLQRVVGSLLSVLDDRNWQECGDLWKLWQRLDPSAERLSESDCPYWLDKNRATIGLDSTACNFFDLADTWRQRWDRPVQLGVQLVDAWNFNQGTLKYGNKASLLSVQTLQLVDRLLAGVAEGCRVVVDCDRHGGRKKYLPILLEVMGADWMKIVSETSSESIYYWQRGDGSEVYFRFAIKGERRFPVAVASQIAKYMREVSMELLNRFWQSKVPGLEKTAGYPVDAKRYFKEIEAAMQKCPLDKPRVWRQK